jgi:hypothetical protein
MELQITILTIIFFIETGLLQAIYSPVAEPSANKINDTDVINHVKYPESNQSLSNRTISFGYYM